MYVKIRVLNSLIFLQIIENTLPLDLMTIKYIPLCKDDIDTTNIFTIIIGVAEQIIHHPFIEVIILVQTVFYGPGQKSQIGMKHMARTGPDLVDGVRSGRVFVTGLGHAWQFLLSL